MRAERREERDRLDEIRLALAVAAHENIRAGVQARHRLPRQYAEVHESEPFDDHPVSLFGVADTRKPGAGTTPRSSRFGWRRYLKVSSPPFSTRRLARDEHGGSACSRSHWR